MGLSVGQLVKVPENPWGSSCGGEAALFVSFVNSIMDLKDVANEECAAQEHVMMVRPLNDDVVIEDYQT